MYRLLFATLCLAAVSVTAADVSIRTVDMKKVFDSYYKTRMFEQVIAKDADMIYLEKLEKEHADIREKLQQIIARTQNMVLSPEAKKDNQQEGVRLATLMREKEQNITRTKRALERRKADERDVIVKEINEVVAKYCQDNTIDVLLDDSGETMNGIPTVVYAKTELEITDILIALLNKGHEKDIEALDKGHNPAEAKPTLSPVDAPADEANDAVQDTEQDK